MNSTKLSRLVRALLAGDFDFEAPSHRKSSGLALFLAGLGAGVVAGMLFAPVSGDELRSRVSDRAREGFDKVKAGAEDLAARAKAPTGQTAAGSSAETRVS
jgi:gas vesicle protein